MVYLTPESLGFLPMVKTWIYGVESALPEKCSEELKAYVYELFETKFPAGIKYLRSGGECKEAIPTTDINVARSCCNIFQSLFSEERGVNFKVCLCSWCFFDSWKMFRFMMSSDVMIQKHKLIGVITSYDFTLGSYASRSCLKEITIAYPRCLFHTADCCTSANEVVQ